MAKLNRRYLQMGRGFVLFALLAVMLLTAIELVGSSGATAAALPLTLLAGGIVSLGWRLVDRGTTSVVLVQALMVVFIAAGAAGLLARLAGNAGIANVGILMSEADRFLQIGLLGLIFTCGPHGERKDEEAFEL